MENKTAYLHMSHLLLVLCFAQSITGSLGKYAETLKMRAGVCHNSGQRWGQGRHRAWIKTHRLQESFQEPSMHNITNENTTCTKLEPVFWNMGKSKFPFTGEKPSISLFCQRESLFSITQHFTAESSCAQAAVTTDSLLLLISQTWAAGFLCWDSLTAQSLCTTPFQQPYFFPLRTIPHSTPTSISYF